MSSSCRSVCLVMTLKLTSFLCSSHPHHPHDRRHCPYMGRPGGRNRQTVVSVHAFDLYPEILWFCISSDGIHRPTYFIYNYKYMFVCVRVFLTHCLCCLVFGDAIEWHRPSYMYSLSLSLICDVCITYIHTESCRLTLFIPSKVIGCCFKTKEKLLYHAPHRVSICQFLLQQGSHSQLSMSDIYLSESAVFDCSIAASSSM